MTNDKNKNMDKNTTPKKVFLCILVLAFVVLAGIFAPSFIKARVLEFKVKQDLVNEYSGAKIEKVKYLKPYSQDEFYDVYHYYWNDYEWPEETLYLCEVYSISKNGETYVVKCLATEDGNVVFDEYAFFYYREELETYITGILDADSNFPGIDFIYTDELNEIGGRMVLTEKCKSFEAYLSNEGAGYELMSDNIKGYASCTIQIGIDSYGDDLELEICKKLADIFISADCKVRIRFIEELDGKRNGVVIANYYPQTGSFEPQNSKIKEAWD